MTMPKAGDVWSYEYLWKREHEAGAEHGRKPRPTAVVTTVVGADGRTHLFILPITSRAPGGDRLSLEVPQIERRRAGLASDLRLWIIFDEYNHEIAESSFYLDPNGWRGAFSSAFTTNTLRLFTQAMRERKVKRVPRTD
ncbi:hypothetical protein [Jannaschia marina]|uniref:hypothetical protein n=1 Tax=Jannaschia marina TaxID=2741674 RepID=UPI0015CE00D5|nr:hypothetical protein [Jannaschia marina]